MSSLSLVEEAMFLLLSTGTWNWTDVRPIDLRQCVVSTKTAHGGKHDFVFPHAGHYLHFWT